MTPPLPSPVVLVDGHSLLYRSYYAVPDFTSPQGNPVGAVYGFMRTLLKLCKTQRLVFVAFDRPEATFRHDVFDGYKAGRSETPESLPMQLETVKQLVDLLGLSRFEVTGYEADDVLATLAKHLEARGIEVHILTGDRDIYQLISDRIKVITSDGKGFIEPKDILEKYGVRVDQWVDFRALSGDPSDNISGVRGIGPKTAAKLLQTYETLERILQATSDGTLEPKSAMKKIDTDRDSALLGQKLSRLVSDLPIAYPLDRPSPDGDALIAFTGALGFDSLREDILAYIQSCLEPWVTEDPDTVSNPIGKLDPEWKLPEDTFWDGVNTARIWGFSSIPALSRGTPEGMQYSYLGGGRSYTPALFCSEDFRTPTVIHAVKAKDAATCLQMSGYHAEPGDDPLLMAYTMDSNITDEKAWVSAFGSDAQEWPADAERRALLSAELLKPTRDALQQWPQVRALYERLERPLSRVLTHMESRGIALDVPYLSAFGLDLGARLEQLKENIYDLAGKVINLNSRDQLEILLFDELGLAASKKKTKATGRRSTAASTLEALREAHPVVPKILEYRELSKLKGTYLDPLPKWINPHTGRLHTTFSQTEVATGRLSSLNPNLQNIPMRTELGRQIRRGFVAPRDHVLICADYNQIELRLMAHMAQDPALMAAFSENADIHRRVAAQVLGIDETQISPDQRRMAKTVNFGVMYGMGAYRLSGELGISYEHAEGFIDRYFGVYPQIRAYIDATLKFCRKHGYVETLLGRRRHISGIDATRVVVREAAERMAYNMPIQGTAADVIKLAMVRLDPKLETYGAQLLLQVHDELVVECPREHVHEVMALIRSEMENTLPLDVPLKVDLGFGDSWFESK